MRVHWLMNLIVLLLALPCIPARGDDAFVEGKFGKSLDLSSCGRHVAVSMDDAMGRRPITFACWVRLNGFDGYNILFAMAPKSGKHWEVYTRPQDGLLSVYMPQVGDFVSDHALKIGTWHYVAIRIAEAGFDLCADGQEVMARTFPHPLQFQAAPLMLGAIERETLRMDGLVDDLDITFSQDNLRGRVPTGPAEPGDKSLAVFHFDDLTRDRNLALNAVAAESQIQARILDDLSLPVGNRFLDEVQEEAFAQSTLHGDDHIEWECRLPVVALDAHESAGEGTGAAPSTKALSLNGEWLLKESKPRLPAAMEVKRLNHEESEGVRLRWFEQGFDRSGWRRVHAPTSVQNALLQLGEIKDPFWDTNTWDELHDHGWPRDLEAWHFRKTRIEQQDWWFARSFELPDEYCGKRLRLYFDGIDYAGSFYLNGRPLGYHAGMFGGPEYDVTNLVRLDAPNELVVRIDAAPDTWSGILKGSPGWGWHYGHLISLGIWRDIEIQAIPDLELLHLFVKTLSIADGEAVLEVEYAVENHTERATDVEVAINLSSNDHAESRTYLANHAAVSCGLNRFRTTFTVKNAHLWWPLNYGDQHMYALNVALRSVGSPEWSDAKRVGFGIRTIEMRPLRGAKEATDYRWQFVINGVPLFIKGANWCWSDPMLQLDPAKYEHILELARRAGIQMFRCWGGGIIETDRFYELCDRKGLMVYQEFPYCWGPPDFSVTDPAVLDQQVSRVVKRLRNHPSLAMWGGGNENVGISGADEGLFLVGRRCRQFDPSRPFHRTSPWGGSVHNWGVFHSGLPIDSGFVNMPSPWYGEFGLPSMTNRDETLKYLPEAKLNAWPPSADGGILMHLNQFSLRDLVKVMRYADYGPITSWDQYTEYSQMAQGDEIRFAANLQRAGSYLNKGGLWFYKMTDLFPGHSWAVVGFYGQPKLSYYRAKQVYAPQAAFAHSRKFDWTPGEPFQASIHVSNDSGRPIEAATVTAIIYGSDLREQWRKEYSVTGVAASSRLELDRIEAALNPDRTTPFLMAVSMRAKDGALLSDQWYWYNFKAKSDAVRELEKLDAWSWPEQRVAEAFKAYAELPEARLLALPQTRLTASLTRSGRSGAITLTNNTDFPAFNVIIEHFPYVYGSYLENNSFCLYPRETRAVAFELVDGTQTTDQLTIKAWNAPLEKLPNIR